MSEEDKEEGKKRNTDWLATVAVLVVTLVAVLYYTFTFGPDVSDNKTDWGTFGDYIGGIMNPFIGFITVLLVLRTLEITKEESETTRKEMKEQNRLLKQELDETQKSAKLQEIERCMEAIVSEIKELLGGTLPGGFYIGVEDSGALRRTHTRESKSVVVDEEGTLELLDNAMIGPRGMQVFSDNRAAVQSDWNIYFDKERRLLMELSVYCNLHEQLSPTYYAANYYKGRVQNLANCLFSAEVIAQRQWDSLLPRAYTTEELGGSSDPSRNVWLSRPELDMK
ncbi:hypothetical protein OVA13_11355 [Pseudoxanthomonas sp. SL93]|uniref:hypothetical protein n=1 Tax=Pseudoxanthomonas sp. SL93 TaxID=2995142 RepID=UPI00227213E5|nr:hypothetical protein [Pseudoxanthomonas sp. SL93]WAC62000.1 hypothetical protein OVA13_11355 [Pseudoxanthomonas sp. SL93]